MNRFLIYAVINGVLFVFFLIKAVPVWFLFLCLSLYYAYRALKPVASEAHGTDAPEDTPVGVLGEYRVDGAGDDLGYGLYVELNGKPVFVDLRKDALFDERKAVARHLFESTDTLQRSLNDFIRNNPDFQGREIGSIGLHAVDLDQAEVFWEPEGYTQLKGLEFRR